MIRYAGLAASTAAVVRSTGAGIGGGAAGIGGGAGTSSGTAATSSRTPGRAAPAPARCTAVLPKFSFTTDEKQLAAYRANNHDSLSVAFNEDICPSMDAMVLPSNPDTYFQLANFPFVPFHNMGNNLCYVNAVIQAIMACESLLKHVLNTFYLALNTDRTTTEFAPIMFAFVSLMTAAAQSQASSTKTPIHVLDHFTKLALCKDDRACQQSSVFGRLFTVQTEAQRRQDDASEFLESFLERMTSANDDIKPFFEITSTVETAPCSNCGATPDAKTDTHLCIHLHPEKGAKNFASKLLLNKLIGEESKAEFKCDTCSTEQNVTRTTTYSITSQYVVFMSIVQWKGTGERGKKELSKIRYEQRIEIGDWYYRLVSQVIWSGDTAHTGHGLQEWGHYVCIRHDKVLDDQKPVRYATLADTTETRNRGTVIAIYERTDEAVPVQEEEEEQFDEEH